jgi:steroid delta-isomerase-like uncharacterized protein
MFPRPAFGGTASWGFVIEFVRIGGYEQMQSDAKAIIHRWFDEVWNQGREAVIEELFAPEGVAVGLGAGEAPVHGPAGFKVFFRNIRTALPDVRIDIDDTIAEGEKVAVRVVLTGTHTGAGLGVAPTGRRVHVAGIVIVQISGGQIVSGWNSWDQLGLLQQLGATPASGDRFLAAEA